MTIQRHEGVNPSRSQMVAANGMITLVMTAPDKTADMKGQTEQTLAEIQKRLHGAGSDKSRIVSALVFIADMDLKNDMDAAWQAWVTPGEGPCRACVQVGLAGAALVEMVVYALPS